MGVTVGCVWGGLRALASLNSARGATWPEEL